MKARSRKRKSCSSASLSMSAVIICDDLVFRARAAATLERVGQRDELNVHWKTIFWPINALNEKELAKKALVDSLDAHLILFPARCAQSLPHWVFDWLDRWATMRTIRDAALGIMADENVPERTKLTPLISFARTHDLTVIVDEQKRKVSGIGFADIGPNPCYRSFGINE
jgi:hypothetical protein